MTTKKCETCGRSLVHIADGNDGPIYDCLYCLVKTPSFTQEEIDVTVAMLGPKIRCPRPGCEDAEDLYFKKHDPHIGAYCGRCGRWIKWIKKSEVPAGVSLGGQE